MACALLGFCLCYPTTKRAFTLLVKIAFTGILYLGIFYLGSMTEAQAAEKGMPSPCPINTKTSFISIEWPEAEEPFLEEVIAELTTEFSDKGIAICLSNSPPKREPVATIRYRWLTQTEQLSLQVDIWDSYSEKQLQRSLIVDSFSSESHAILAAVAASELLKASWAEYLLSPLQRRHAPELTQPQQRIHIEKLIEKPLRPLWRSGVGFFISHHTGGLSTLGPTLQLAHEFGDYLEWALNLRMPWVLPTQIEGYQFTGTLPEVELQYRAPFHLGAHSTWTIGAGVSFGAMLSTAASSQTQVSSQEWLADLRALSEFRQNFGNALLAFEVGLQLPLHSIQFHTSEETVWGRFGLGMDATLIGGWNF